MNVGLFCVDPGGHTGVAWAICNPLAHTVEEAMKTRMHTGSTTTTGSEPKQIRDLYKLWVDFKAYAVNEALLPVEQVQLVFEDFVLRGGQHSGGRDGTTPERIAWGFEGYRMGRLDQWKRGHQSYHYTPIVWQLPASASRFRSKNRLDAYDAWVKGREHERSAYSHMALRLATILR